MKVIYKVDSHHTIEDVGWALGKGINKALGEKRGIKRYSLVFCQWMNVLQDVV